MQAKFTVATGNNYCLSVPKFTAYTWSAAQSLATVNSVRIITRTLSLWYVFFITAPQGLTLVVPNYAYLLKAIAVESVSSPTHID